MAPASDALKIGLYRLADLVSEPNVNDAERMLGTRVGILSFYRAWNRALVEDDFSWFARIRSAPRTVLLTWEPWRLLPPGRSPQNQPAFRLKEILSGRYDRYIRGVARELQAFPGRVLLRPMHEMNGCWYPWCGMANGNRPETFTTVWSHLRRLFREEGSQKPEWVWSPYVRSYPEVSSNGFAAYYPGDDQVDWIALDGYNWGGSRPWSRWQEFEELFLPARDEIRSFSSRPMIVGETGCSEEGGSKAAWIARAAEALAGRLADIEAMVWFDEDKECNWRIASSPESLASFRAVFGDSKTSTMEPRLQ